MMFEKRFDTYYSKDGYFFIRVSNGHSHGIHSKYSITCKSQNGVRHASTLKEAKEICKKWKAELEA